MSEIASAPGPLPVGIDDVIEAEGKTNHRDAAGVGQRRTRRGQIERMVYRIVDNVIRCLNRS